MDAAWAVVTNQFLERMARRQEAVFLGLPPFTVRRDWMGRPVRLEPL